MPTEGIHNINFYHLISLLTSRVQKICVNVGWTTSLLTSIHFPLLPLTYPCPVRLAMWFASANGLWADTRYVTSGHGFKSNYVLNSASWVHSPCQELSQIGAAPFGLCSRMITQVEQTQSNSAAWTSRWYDIQTHRQSTTATSNRSKKHIFASVSHQDVRVITAAEVDGFLDPQKTLNASAMKVRECRPQRQGLPRQIPHQTTLERQPHNPS